ncbi:hypothetical protein XENORESO_008505, partial [Xenotaenia resolanae]
VREEFVEKLSKIPRFADLRVLFSPPSENRNVYNSRSGKPVKGCKRLEAGVEVHHPGEKRVKSYNQNHIKAVYLLEWPSQSPDLTICDETLKVRFTDALHLSH